MLRYSFLQSFEKFCSYDSEPLVNYVFKGHYYNLSIFKLLSTRIIYTPVISCIFDSSNEKKQNYDCAISDY